MRYFRYILACACMAFAHGMANAAEICKLNKASEALACAIKKHPGVVQSAASASVASANKEISGRWFNPEIEGGIGYSKAEADGIGYTADIAIMQTIETPAKRKARKGRAEAEYVYAGAEAEGQKEQAALEMLSILNRLRQIEREMNVLDETIGTFARLIKKYRARPALSPEDQVSKDLFGFALNNYTIEKNRLEFEEKKLKGTLSAILGGEATAGKKLFLYSPKTWPVISDDSEAENIAIMKESANVIKAKADYLEAKSSPFGGFRVGPYIQTEPGNFGKIDTYGVKFSFPLPIYANSDLKSAGRMSVSSAEFALEAKRRELFASFANMKSEYATGVKILGSYNIASLEKNHAKVEKLFDGGRVGGALLIEAHRQMVDSVRTYHGYEMETLEALWRIYMLQRKLLTNLNEVYYEK